MSKSNRLRQRRELQTRLLAKKDAQALLEGVKIHDGEGDVLLDKIETTSTRKLSYLSF